MASASPPASRLHARRYGKCHKLRAPPPQPSFAAQMDVVGNGPSALQKYSGDKAVVEAWNEAAGILEQLQGGGGGGGGEGQ